MNEAAAIQRLIEVCRRQHKSLSTERIYALWLKDYMRFLRTLDGSLARERKLEAFLSMLALRRNVAASTQNQAFNAVCFFYKDVLGQPLQAVDALRATRPARIRTALSQRDTMRLLDAVPDLGGYPTALLAKMLYGCGLRVSEPLNVRIKDVRLEEGALFIMGAKGGKDRLVRLPCSLAVGLEQQMAYARAVWERDRLAKIPVVLPNQLAAKYPAYQFAWPWAWLFPSHHPCRHPRTGAVVRWHCLPCNVQRAVRRASDALGMCVTPHNLRHCYATHCLDRGANIKALAEAMGHAQITTTEGYCHAEALSVGSPLDTATP